MKNIFSFLALSITFLGLLLITTYPRANKAVSTTPAFGKVLVSVLDISEHTPIKNATVCVIETKEYFSTNSLGQTKAISLPAKTQQNYNLTPPTKTQEEYTLLIYKSGYFPHIYHGLKISSGKTKTGVVIFLTELYPEADFLHTESYEFPPSEWSTELIKKYKK